MRLVHGFGVNDSSYQVYQTVNGLKTCCGAYQSWKGMIRRCYSKKYHIDHPTYIGVTVCDEWRSFMAFRSWWVENYVDGFQLDKDIIGSGRVYSPDFCIYVPQWLNSFMNSSGASRGNFKIGCYFDEQNRKFRAQCGHPFYGVRFIGLFNTEQEAHLAWVKEKICIARELRGLMDDINPMIFHKVVEKILTSK